MENNLQKKIGFPLVVKPLNEGSSVNVFICNKNNILKTLTKLNEYGEVLLEKYIPGREIQVATCISLPGIYFSNNTSPYSFSFVRVFKILFLLHIKTFTLEPSLRGFTTRGNPIFFCKLFSIYNLW